MSETPEVAGHRLWRLWQQGQQPDLAEFLSGVGPLGPLELAAVLRVDQRQRWLSGQHVPAEQYLRSYPAVATNEEAALDLIYAEFLLRQEQGEAVAPWDYLQRFPQFGEPLRLQLDFAVALAKTPPAATSPLWEESGGESGEQRATSAEQFLGQTGSEGLPPLPEKERADPFADGFVPGYQNLGVLGRGGMGVVYKAMDLELKRCVALKFLNYKGTGRPEWLARFRAEAEATAQLQHPHIVPIYRIDEHAHQPYLVLEFLGGGSLAAKLADAPLPARAAAELVETLARAMHAAHDQGIIHRDLKPANVLLTLEGTPKITDFGLAKLRKDSPEDQALTAPDAILGTPSYMAPEQAAGNVAAISRVTDVYALGALLYETLTGRPPFRGATTLDTLDQVRTREPVPPRALQPNLPRDLETIILKCLRKEQDQRYATALALAEDLRHFLNGQPIRARPVPAWERAGKWARRRPAAATLVVLGLVGILSLLGAGTWHRLRETARLNRLRQDVQPLIDEGRVALAGQDWPEAQHRFERVLELVHDEAPLAELETQALTLLNQAQSRRRASDKIHGFLASRDDALFLLHGLQFGEVALPADLEEGTRKTQEALARVLKNETGTIPILDPDFSEPQKHEVLSGCCELVLVLAQGVSSRSRASPGHVLTILNALAPLDPPVRTYHLRRSELLTQAGDLPGAKASLARAEELSATGTVDHFLTGAQAYQQNKLDQAVQSFTAALTSQPDHFWAEFFRAVCLLRQHRPAEAIAGLTVCRDRRPKFVWLFILRGLAYGESKAFAAAEADFQQALDLTDDAEAHYALLVNRGVLRLRQGQWDAAAQDLQKACDAKPDRYQAFVNLAQVYDQQGKHEAAIQQLDHAISLQPPGLAALFENRALLHLKRGNTQAARADAQRAIECEPPEGPAADRARHLLLLGKILYQSQDYAAALEKYQQAAQLSPESPQADRYCAEALLKLGKYPEAAQAYARCLTKGLRHPDVFSGRGQARMKLQPPDYGGAAEDYTLAMTMTAKPSADFHEHRGWAYYFAKAEDLALVDFQKALEIRATATAARVGRGLCLAKKSDQYRQAVADAEQVKPETAEMIYNVACIFALASEQVGADTTRPERGKLVEQYRDQALHHLRKALPRRPDEQLAFWRGTVENDETLSSIRRSPGFLQLQHEIEAAAARSQK